MKGLKKISLLGLASLALLLPTITKAEKICEKYTNYYFFSQIYGLSGENGLQNQTTTGILKRSHRTYFDKLPAGNILESSSYDGERVCLSKNGKADGNCAETWTLDKFYTIYKKIMKNGKEITVDQDIVNTVLTEGTTNYFLHGKWYAMGENGQPNTDTGEDRVTYDKIDTNVLIQNAMLLYSTATYKPTAEEAEKVCGDECGTSIHMDVTKDNSIFATIDRNIVSGHYAGMTGFTLSRPIGGTLTNVTDNILAPALYKIEYQLCEDKYKAEIEYFVKESDGKLTPAVEYDKKITDYSRDGLDDGYEESVATPKLSGCTADKAKVNVKIDGKDFYDKVVYTCPTNDEPSVTPKTGDALIYFAWAIGLGAIGYSVYYFKKTKKEEI